MIIVSLLIQLLSGVEDEFLYNLRNLQNQRCKLFMKRHSFGIR